MGYTKIAGTPVITGLYTILLPIAVFALFGSSRHLVVGADSASAAIMATGLVAIGRDVPGRPSTSSSPRWRAHVRGAPDRRPDPQARVHRQLPVAERAHRLPDRRRDPGRDGPVRRPVRGQRGQRHDAREVRQRAPGDPDRDERADADRVDRRCSSRSSAWSGSTRRSRAPSSRSSARSPRATSSTSPARGVTDLGTVPGGLPPIGLPTDVSHDRDNISALLPTVFSMFVVILAQSAATSRAYADEVRRQLRRERRPHRARRRPTWRPASPARSSSTAARPRPRWSTAPVAGARSPS